MAAFGNVTYAGDNTVARPLDDTVYWKGWPANTIPTNAQAGDLIYVPDA